MIAEAPALQCRDPGPFLRTRRTPASALQAQIVVLGFVPNWATTGEKRTITTVVGLYGKLYLAFVVPSGDLLYTLFIFIRQLN